MTDFRRTQISLSIYPVDKIRKSEALNCGYIRGA